MPTYVLGPVRKVVEVESRVVQLVLVVLELKLDPAHLQLELAVYGRLVLLHLRVHFVDFLLEILDGLFLDQLQFGQQQQVVRKLVFVFDQKVQVFVLDLPVFFR